MMDKIFNTLIPIVWLGGTFFLMCYYAWEHQFDLLFITIITLLNSIVLGSLLNQQKNK